MSARAERALTANRPKKAEIIVNFSPEELKAPFVLRCGALIIDYIVLVAVPVVGILLSRSMGNDGARLLNSEINNLGWLIAVLLGLTNFLIIPLFSGQSLGKLLTGLRILCKDGTPVSFSKILLRQLVGYPLTILTAGLGFLWAGVSRDGRALHDYLAGTVVIHGRRRVLPKQLK